MKEINNRSVLVIFGQDPPRKSKKWLSQFDKVLGPKEVEELISSGNVQEAHRLLNKLPHLTVSDGRRVSKLINYQGYELWWMNYDNLMSKFCLPYTQYYPLLEYLKNFNKTYLYQPPFSHLFQYFLNVHNRQCVILDESKKIFPPLGILFQVILSLPFLLWLRITRPKLMVRTSDQFSPSGDYDFRMKYIYEELRKREIPFVEFIRSQERFPIVLKHALARKRPVVYSGAIISFLYYIGKWFGKRKQRKLMNLLPSGTDPEQQFWFLVATHYLRNIAGTIWSIQVMKFILQWIGIRAAIIIAVASRTLHEVLGCKLAGIKTIGIQHGFTPRYYPVADFMPTFNGELSISLDRYGLWSDWWKDYYLKYSRVFKPKQLYVSGLMRPLEERDIAPLEQKKERSKVLFISEQLAAPKETLPFLSAFLKIKDFDLYFKFRPYRDGFELWLKENQPELYKTILEKTKVLRGTAEEAIRQCDVVVGSHSTAALEGLLQLKPVIFFRTNKWGDYFEIKNLDVRGCFFAENPQELFDCLKESVNVPKEDLKKLRERFFGNLRQNGSKWVVEQAIKYLDEYKKNGTK